MISTLDSLASVKALAGYQQAAEQQSRAERGLKDEFLAAARKGDMEAAATFAPMVRDWNNKADTNAKRSQQVGEVLFDSLDYTNGPQVSEALAILCAVAYGDQPQVAAARELLDRMAAKWAQMNVVVE